MVYRHFIGASERKFPGAHRKSKSVPTFSLQGSRNRPCIVDSIVEKSAIQGGKKVWKIIFEVGKNSADHTSGRGSGVQTTLRPGWTSRLQWTRLTRISGRGNAVLELRDTGSTCEQACSTAQECKSQRALKLTAIILLLVL